MWQVWYLLGGVCGDCGSPGGSLRWPHPVARLTFDHCWLPGSNVGLRENTSLILHPYCEAKPPGTGCRMPPWCPLPTPYPKLHWGSTMRVLLKYDRSFLYLPVHTHPSCSTLPTQAANRQASALMAGSGRPLPLVRVSLCDGG